MAGDGTEAPPPAARRGPDDPELTRLRGVVEGHPVHGCPDRADHERWMQRRDQLQRETETLEARVRRRTGSLVRTFDRVLAVLDGLGYVDGFALTGKGETLRRLYAEADLVVCEAMHRGVWSDLDPAELAATVSTLVYEPRGRDAPAGPVVLPTQRVRAAVETLTDLQAEVANHEQANSLHLVRPVELDFADRTWRWARGEDLEDVLDGEVEITPGDFVRSTKQLIDLLGQVAAVAPDRALGRIAHAAASALNRGVVAYSSVA